MSPTTTPHRRLARGCAVAALVSLPALSAAPAYAHSHGSTSPVSIRLDPMPGSTAKGTAMLTPTADGGLTVHVQATGMVPGMPHAQHIHGDVSGHRFVCPTSSDDKDRDGFLTVEEGLPKYGGIHISLTTKGDTSAKSGLAVDRFPVADAEGMLDYSRTLSAGQLPEGTLAALDHLHVVQHGVDANDNAKYDVDGLGESSFAKSMGVSGIPAEATDVATCGMPMPSGGVETGGTPPAQPKNAMLAGGVGAAAVLLAVVGTTLRRRRAHA